jgi:hypothetical protein
MKPGFYLWMLKPKSGQSSVCTHIHQRSRKSLNERCLPSRKLMSAVFWGSKGVLMVKFMQQGTTITSEVYWEILLKNCLGPTIENKRRGMLTYGLVLLHGSARPHTARPTRALLEHFSWECLTTLLTALILLRATTTCLPAWRTSWNHSASTVMRSWGKVSKRGWAHRRQTSLTQAYKNLFPDMTSASIPAVSTLTSSISIYVIMCIIFLFSLHVLLTAHQRLLSASPSYYWNRWTFTDSSASCSLGLLCAMLFMIMGVTQCNSMSLLKHLFPVTSY